MNEQIITQAAKVIADAGYCVLALIDTDEYPTAATISPSKTEGIASVTFCTGLGSNWAERVEKCSRASVCFNSDTYNITLVGDIEILTDIETKKSMWYDGMGSYFSGPEDHGFCVLRFTTKRYSLMLEESNGVFRGEI